MPRIRVRETLQAQLTVPNSAKYRIFLFFQIGSFEEIDVSLRHSLVYSKTFFVQTKNIITLIPTKIGKKSGTNRHGVNTEHYVARKSRQNIGRGLEPNENLK